MILNIDISLKVLTALVSVLALVISIVGSRRRELDAQIKGLSDRVTGVERDQQSLAERVSAMPSARELRDLELGLAGIKGTLEGLSATLSGQRDILTRLEMTVRRQEDFLMKADR